ncbi:acetyltransferase [Paenibacillus glacialis]|uniref:Acetyltransferase n=2 Tax=Paenibacillus glacialis TaxID=494026 RepID=A0A168N1R3_9BACL|nr:acetyltransferase [Paenibacillus glacialis]
MDKCIERGTILVESVELLDEIEIRNFQEGDMPLLGELYNSVNSRENATFWWVGDSDNWVNVFCAFEQGKMIAKGQVSIIDIVPSGRSAESKHLIYLNLKTIAERETDLNLLEQLYPYLYSRAMELKESLSHEHGTLLCVGNDPSENANSQFFIQQKGFRHRESLFTMERDLTQSIPELQISDDLQCTPWAMESSQEEIEYLQLEAQIWPDTALGMERLSQYKQNPLWTAMVVREADTIVGSLMAWREEGKGVIEDVFVREPWRNRGIAKYMLIQALNYLKGNGLESAELMVLTTNNSALSLYGSVGFNMIKEEVRYCVELSK